MIKVFYAKTSILILTLIRIYYKTDLKKDLMNYLMFSNQKWYFWYKSIRPVHPQIIYLQPQYNNSLLVWIAPRFILGKLWDIGLYNLCNFLNNNIYEWNIIQYLNILISKGKSSFSTNYFSTFYIVVTFINISIFFIRFSALFTKS